MNDARIVEDKIEYLDTMRLSDKERYKAFVSYLVDKGAGGGGGGGIKKSYIAKKSGINKAYLDFDLFYDLTVSFLIYLFMIVHYPSSLFAFISSKCFRYSFSVSYISIAFKEFILPGPA